MQLKRIIPVILLFILIYLLNSSVKHHYTGIYTDNAVHTERVYRYGDSISWKDPNFDDSNWSSEPLEAPYFGWHRIWVTLDSTNLNKPVGLGLWSNTCSYDVFWDGDFIGSNGSFDNLGEESPGQIDKIFPLRDTLATIGKHLVALRATQQRGTKLTTQPYVVISNYDSQSKWLIVVAALIHIFTGAFLIISIYYFFVYFKSYRQTIFLFFALICLLLFFESIMHFVKFYYKYPYPFHLVRRTSIELLTMSLSICLSYYFLLLYQVKKRVLYTMGLFLVLTLSFFIFQNSAINIRIYVLYSEGVLFSLALTIWAVIKNKENSLSSLYSLVAPSALLFFLEIYFYDLMIYVSFFAFIIFNLYTLSQTIGAQKRQYEKYLVESNRLKVELLKKNIQPHFILNTLTSLISWVEESPSVAVKFIEALALEFRLLVDVADCKEISLASEIQLCVSHMKIMSYRNEIDYQIAYESVDLNEMVPPAIFLTLVENAITHNIHESDKVIFRLTYQQTAEGKTYNFFSPGLVQSIEAPIKDGTGMKYIKARMSETYGNKWEIESGKEGDGWCVQIQIFKQ